MDQGLAGIATLALVPVKLLLQILLCVLCLAQGAYWDLENL
jgi:hypothetical protein